MTLAPTQRFVSFLILAPWVYTIISIFWTASRGRVVDGELPVVGLACFESGQRICVCKWGNWFRFILYMTTSLCMNGFWAALSRSRGLGDWTEGLHCGWYHGDVKLLRWVVWSLSFSDIVLCVLDLPSLPRSCACYFCILAYRFQECEVDGRQQYPSILPLDIEETGSFFRYFIRKDIEAWCSRLVINETPSHWNHYVEGRAFEILGSLNTNQDS